MPKWPRYQSLADETPLDTVVIDLKKNVNNNPTYTKEKTKYTFLCITTGKKYKIKDDPKASQTHPCDGMDTAPHPGVNKKRPLAPRETSTEGLKTGKNPKQKIWKIATRLSHKILKVLQEKIGSY